MYYNFCAIYIYILRNVLFQKVSESWILLKIAPKWLILLRVVCVNQILFEFLPIFPVLIY